MIKVQAPESPTLGYFARMCREKGLDVLVEAFIILKERNRVKNLKLKIGGGCGPADEPLVDNAARAAEGESVSGRRRIFSQRGPRRQAGVSALALRFLRAGALWRGVRPCMSSKPSPAACRWCSRGTRRFPNWSKLSGGGVLCEPGNPGALADALEAAACWIRKKRARSAARAQKSVREKFSAGQMAAETIAGL